MKILIFILLLCLNFAYAQNEDKHITVTGTSELIIPADQINFTVHIKTIAESIRESKKLNDKYLNELLSIIKNENISKDDIEVSPISLGKNYELTERERKQNGYYASVVVTFILKDLEKYVELTDNLSANNYFEVSSAYSISNYEAQHKAAYEKALLAAKEKAEYMIKTLGIKLGGILQVEENGAMQPFPNPFNTSTRMDSQTNGISGKVNITRSVKIKFALE